MRVARTDLTGTAVRLEIAAGRADLKPIMEPVLKKLATNVRVPGFRAGRAPNSLVAKQVDQSILQTEFLDKAINELYVAAVTKEKLRPAASPTVTLSKFVPFETLEFRVEVETIGEVKLPDYKNIKVVKPEAGVTAKDVADVIKQLQAREAQRQVVLSAAKNGDEAVIDFKGVDAATKKPIAGAEGKDYPLLLGSGVFIPGFEPEVVGLKPGGQKTFTLTFPKDYSVAALQNRAVSFEVKLKKLHELVAPALDDKFALAIGPFKTLADLKADIKKQLKTEREREAQGAFENELVTKITEKAEIYVPKSLVDEQLAAMEEEEKRNLAYRGQTWPEHLMQEGVSEQQHQERNRPVAEQQVKIGLVLSEIAEKEKITVTPEELEIRIQFLKNQYKDPQMQAELAKPEARRDIMSRLLTEKTLAKLKTYVSV